MHPENTADSSWIKINFNGKFFEYRVTVEKSEVTIHCCSATVTFRIPPGSDPLILARSEAISAIQDGRFRDPNSCTHSRT